MKCTRPEHRDFEGPAWYTSGMSVVPLHVHSWWSLLDGVPSVAQWIDHARSTGLTALGLTDTNALYGAVEFVARCREADLHPVVGAEMSVAGGHSLVLLAQDQDGYASLCRLVTRLQAAPDRAASLARGLSPDDLAAHSRGLIALSGGHAGPLDAPLRRGDVAAAERAAADLLSVFGRDRLFIELQILASDDESIALQLQTLADRLGVQTVATHDVRFCSPDDAPRHRVLTAMREGKRLADVPFLPDRSLPTQAAMERKFARYPHALANTVLIAEQCRLDLPLDQMRFPMLDLPAGRTPREELWSLAVGGVAHRYGGLTPALQARLRKEMDIIDALGYAPYFLVVADIVRFAREQGVPISPRGSASSSVVAYCLGIHDVDPIAHNLYFERFLSLERRDPPDIDLDLCSRRRDEVIAYVYRRYGADHVAMVCTYATLRPRLALREVGKVYGLAEARIKTLSERLPWFWSPAARVETEAELDHLLQDARDPIERAVLTMSRALDGTPHHLSVHPGGIVISPGPIADLVPLQYATKGLLITQLDLAGIARLGLVKIDLLGISALTVIADCVDMIRRRQPDYSIGSIPLADEATSRALSTAQTIGCFQIESPGMRLTLREIAARTPKDVLVALALFRPGPLKGGLKDAFVRRHHGQEGATYLHPSLEPILRESHGVILYQEQVLRLAHEIAGLTLGQADLLRRAMSKKSERDMARLHAQFLEGAHVVSGIDPATAEQVWELMAAFAGYGFPKAHAAGYASVAYHMAYLKTHFPAEFMAARLAVWGGYYSPRMYASEARRLGLVVKPPHINHSHEAFTLERPGTLWMGLGQVRELTHVTLKAIVSGQPYTSLEDFLTRVQPLHVEAVNLVKAGALDGLGSPRAMLMVLDQAKWRGRHSAQMGLTLPTPAAAAAEQTLQDQADWQREVLGWPVSVHPLQLLASELSMHAVTHSDQLPQAVGQEVALAGIRLSAHRFSSSRQEPMLLVDMEDEKGMYQVLWSGQALRQTDRTLSRSMPVLVRGRVRTDRQGLLLVTGRSLVPLSTDRPLSEAVFGSEEEGPRESADQTWRDFGSP